MIISLSYLAAMGKIQKNIKPKEALNLTRGFSYASYPRLKNSTKHVSFAERVYRVLNVLKLKHNSHGMS